MQTSLAKDDTLGHSLEATIPQQLFSMLMSVAAVALCGKRIMSGAALGPVAGSAFCNFQPCIVPSL